MVNILTIGDPHFKQKGIGRYIKMSEEIVNCAKKLTPDAIVILGDVLHTHERTHQVPFDMACKMIIELSKISLTVVLIGNHDFCVGKDIPILAWNGKHVMSQDIKIGDILTGDDGKPRKVLSLTNGHSKMYNIFQSKAINYTVTGKHILTLKCDLSKTISLDNFMNGWIVEWVDIKSLELKSKFFLIKIDAIKYLKSISDADIIDISVKDYFKVSKNVRDKLYGFKSRNHQKEDNNILDINDISVINITSSNETEYYGWTLDGNGRFLLSDFTVTHNCDNQQYLTDRHFFNSLKGYNNIIIVDKPMTIKIGKYNFGACPYVYPGLFMKALFSYFDTKSLKGCRAIFGHQEIRGIQMGAITSEKGDIWEDNLPLLITGHIHEFCILQDNVTYVGTPIQHNFDDGTDKGIYLFVFDDNNYKMTKFVLDVPMKRIYRVTIDEFRNFSLVENIEAKIIILATPEQYIAVEKEGLVQYFRDCGASVIHEDITNKKNISGITPSKPFLHILYDRIKQDKCLKETYIDIYGQVNSDLISIETRKRVIIIRK